ncbi:MAG: UDP-N-acetylmuramate dehydrogenase [Bdellovibrionaceae bacterium]|nr:UDP-N-acetylmuramate dehydrogenase [Pseudobdellovibrionaceae bacterium]
MQQPKNLKENYSLKRLNSWRVGGEARYFATPSSVDELKALLLWASFYKIVVFILADGTNLLISDKPLEGLVIGLKKLRTSTEEIKEIENKKDISSLSFSLLSGTPKNDLFSICLKQHLSASIFLAGLPGSVGGGVVMNAGVGFDVCPKEFKDIVDWVEVLSFNPEDKSFKKTQYKKSELLWGYRSCKNWQSNKNNANKDIITKVGFCFSSKEFDKPLKQKQVIENKVQEAQVFRKTKQPVNTFNCGSVFKNPKGYSAGALIDECGLKLASVGGASVSQLHANFIVAEKGTKSTDIFLLIKKIQNTVLEKKNIALNLEVKLMGSFN